MTRSSTVYNAVRRRILKGELAPGQPLSWRRIAAEVRTSVIPVAEALHRLEFEGLVESRPRAGTRVRIPSKEDVEGHYIVREALEVEAARRVAALASRRELALLSALAHRVDGLARRSERTLYTKAHQQFHRSLAARSRCKALSEALDRAHAFSRLWWCHIEQPAQCELATRHHELIDAISSGNPDTAAEAMTQHIVLARQRSMESLEPLFQRRAAALGQRFDRVAGAR